MRRLITVSVFLAFLISCNKDKGNNVSDYKLSKVYYGFYAPLREYTVTYSGNNITELNGAGEKFVFDYDAAGNLVTKQRFNTVTNTLLKKETLAYNSMGQIASHKNYSYENNPTGELTYSKDFSYEKSKLSGTNLVIYGSGQNNSYREKITWANENEFTAVGYDLNGTPVGCLSGTKYVFDAEKNIFNEAIPKFRFLDINFGGDKNVVFLNKNVLRKIDYTCDPSLPGGYNFTYKYDPAGKLIEVYESGYVLWKFEYN